MKELHLGMGGKTEHVGIKLRHSYNFLMTGQCNDSQSLHLADAENNQKSTPKPKSCHLSYMCSSFRARKQQSHVKS